MGIIKYELFCFLLVICYWLLQDMDKGMRSYISIANPHTMDSLIVNNMYTSEQCVLITKKINVQVSKWILQMSKHSKNVNNSYNTMKIFMVVFT